MNKKTEKKAIANIRRAYRWALNEFNTSYRSTAQIHFYSNGAAKCCITAGGSTYGQDSETFGECNEGEKMGCSVNVCQHELNEIFPPFESLIESHWLAVQDFETAK